MSYNALNDVTYLGDGVYAKFDGYGIELRANDAERPTDVVYIEPQVYKNLGVFVGMITEKQNNPVKK